MHRLWRHVQWGVTIGLAGWIGIDAYARTVQAGPRFIWGLLAAVLTLVALQLSARRSRRIVASHDDGSMITDERGEKRRVAHAESAGLLAAELPRSVQRDVARAGVSHLSTQYRLPHWSYFAACAGFAAAFLLIYGGAPGTPSVFPIMLTGLLACGYSARPAAMKVQYLRHGRCPCCAYDLTAIPPQPDGCTQCPECGGTWRLAPART